MNTNNRFLMVVAASLSIFCSQSSWAAAVASDSLFVNFGGAVNVTKTISEPVPGQPEGIADIAVMGNDPVPFFLPKTGYVLFFEPPTATGSQALSDVLVSYTGSSLQLFSDGSQGFPTIDSLNQAGLRELGRFTEGVNGISQNVGDLYGIGAAQIRVVSDGDVVPVPAAAWLFLSGFAGLIGFARRGMA